MKVKSDNKLIFAGLIIVIVLMFMAIRLAWRNRPVDVSKMSEEEVSEYVENKIENIEKKDLSEKGERDRMEKYVSNFIECVEDAKYEEAYEMLYDDFKANYFPTLESFTEYAKAKFPKFISLEDRKSTRLNSSH